MFLRILEVIFPIVAIVICGLYYGKCYRPDMALPNRLNMNVFIPALLFHVLIEQVAEAEQIADLAIAAALVVLGSGLLAWPISKLLKIDPKTLCPPMMFVNAGNIGLPLMVMAFGEQALAAAVVVFLVENLLHITLGTYLLDHRAKILQMLSSPMVIAVISPIVLGILGISVHSTILIPIQMLGQIAIPLMLFSLGVRLADVDMSDWRLGLFAAVLAPVLGVCLVLIVTPWFELSKVQQGVLFMFGALPPAVLNYMFAEHYDQEPLRVASIVLISNAFALISIPLALVYALPKFG